MALEGSKRDTDKQEEEEKEDKRLTLLLMTIDKWAIVMFPIVSIAMWAIYWVYVLNRYRVSEGFLLSE